MHAKLDNFKHNGLPQSYRETAFVKISEVVQQKILVLSAARQIKTGKSKRAKTSGRILTRETLKGETKVQKAMPGRRCKPTARNEHAAQVLQPSQAEWALHPREIWVQPRQEVQVQHQHEAWV
ncbi:hypothetical protein PC118_g18888 [Phytophthora cactorum]|nr:hypothetical protein PC111_g19138 [Phytophthora cactorum]KAG2803102.1 hypothetical protein PC112_g19326 [Phytophthora cactorum]KAG2838415.1 hypothetical protein PC113_g19666 [Phytophthora cactorum]KAG2966900.1 hypothetical protein PC118_g18888 [Phytophthora cactorum]KAG3062467.1 hypothetical protein PC122_g19256 [Phytophthora cactorum]